MNGLALAVPARLVLASNAATPRRAQARGDERRDKWLWKQRTPRMILVS